MLMELGYFEYTAGVQRQASIQGYPINGLLIFCSAEDVETATYITVRTPTGTLVERILLDHLHQISDYTGGNANDNSTGMPGYTYIDLGLVALGDSEELSVIVDCASGYGSTSYVGIAAVIDDLPEHDELIYHYQHHTDTSFSSDAASGLFVFKSSIATSADLINVKVGDDTRSTTLRACNWYANIMGKIETDNVEMGVVFDNKYGQPMTMNTVAQNITSIVRRIVQVDDNRAAESSKRLAKAIVRKYDALDNQTKRAIP